MTGRRVWVVLIAMAVLAAAFGILRLSEHKKRSSADSSERIVLASQTMPTASVPGQPLHVMIVSGETFHDQAGVVLSDDQCQPDADGISHCLNTIRLASGETLTVRHPHDMAKVACLAPGERVMVRINA